MGDSTVVSVKSSFLRSQTRLLTQPVQPSSRWAERNSKQENNLPDETVRDVLREVNRILRRHNKSVYSSLSIQHVAEQIDKLYWNAGGVDLYSSNPGSEDTSALLRVHDDFTEQRHIDKLPEEWEDEDDPTATEEAQEEYRALTKKLQSLSERRKALRNKLESYQQLESLLAPFQQPLESVQPNLVTRDSELAAELEKTHALGIRVAARVATMKE
ncbi:hypothetical protein P152DRAFT_455335 [Eremomyces bilateralis CBS 781.70]|uniref:Kinetochore protein fta4 n=1 Tax=Eremomyces bilateralis CBS 781.70 TaxID=1392243 RepID=A0A6G1GBZ5_9PEZI|nr:uncharacterized protein P152DRAFT_455335 [Eremomyces bilateralis CBS 781.70]KAF1815618.1 hypothetical protein P152DRAFT_455335 [Eremomyces bilateralis CBS 781.70]